MHMSETKKARIAKLRMREDIERHPTVAFHVLETIWARQKPIEQFTLQHHGHDGRGFTKDDTEALNALYERYEEAGRKWWMMSAVDVVRCQRMMPKYARQMLKAQDEAKERMTA